MSSRSRPASPANNGQQHVRIDIWSTAALIDPPVPALAPYLEYRIKRFEEGGPLGYKGREEAVAIWGIDVKGRMAIPAGLVPRVQRALAEYGYQVKVTDHRTFTERFARDEGVVKRLHGDDRRLVDALRREPLGQIQVTGFTDMLLTMRLIIEVYPEARVLILVATKTLARKIRYKLDEMALEFNVVLMAWGWPPVSPRCMVSTFAPMDTFRPEAWDIILLPDAGGAVGDWNTRAMAGLLNHSGKDSLRVYAFLPPGTQLGRRGRIRLEAMAGPVIYRLSPDRVGVRVLWLPTPDAAKIPRDAPALAFKRQAYWHNRNRNDYIAAVARAFHNVDGRKLAGDGVPFKGDKPVLRNSPDTRVAVLVASTAQAREMSKRLPEWTVLDALPARNEAAATGTRGTIITETAAGQDGLAADVVIRAGGSTGLLCLKGFPPVFDSDKRDAILVDFTDGFDERARRDADRRHREYDLRGWESEPRAGKQASRS